MDDAYKLERFIRAQALVYEQVAAELHAGCKRSHWMWFIFPQLAGLGRSAMALQYGIGSLDEARAYLGHALLGERLRQCCALALAVQGRRALEVFGAPDDVKFRSSLTLFAAAAPGEALFQQCLDQYFAGAPDSATLALIATGFA